MLAGRGVGSFDPAREAIAVGRDMKIPGAAFEIDTFADEPHGAGIGLEKAEVGMAVDGELRILMIGA